MEMAKNQNKDLRRFQQEKQEFINGLRNFHYNRGTSFHLLPRCGNKEVDLYKLYQKVTTLGGWKKVTETERWNEVLEELNLPVTCLGADQAVKFIYIRYLNIYEQIHFLGEDPKLVDTRRDDEGPIRKKHCGPQYSVPLTYNHSQHDVAVSLRGTLGLCTTYARNSDYDKLEKALLSGLPNEVDFVINVCTLLSNESKHTLRLDKCAVLTDLLLAHIGLFNQGDEAMEKLYENGWRNYCHRDFIRFWFDTVDDDDARKLISFTRKDSRSLAGKGVLQLGRDLGVEDKEGIRITQVAIIIRNLSFDLDNMKYLANNDLVFRFLMLCLHCSYGTLRQLALDTLGNLAGQFILDSKDSGKSDILFDLLVKCITSSDKFAVVTGLEMVSKLSQLDENEYFISERLDTSIYEEIAKYLTISDIQLIVYSLEALYQLSEIGEETNSKIAETSNTVDTLVSLITVEAQSYGPNSLIGIKVVEYCPPPHLTGGVAEGVPAAVGPPPGSGTNQPSQSQPPGPQGSMVPASSLNKKGNEKSGDRAPEPPATPSPMETTACNWIKANYETGESAVTAHISMYKEYLAFCKKFQLSQPLSSQDFLYCLQIVFPKASNCMAIKDAGTREMCVLGVKKRPQQLPFSICCPVTQPACSVSVAPGLPSIRPHSSAIHSPNLAQRLASPLPSRSLPSMPLRPSVTSRAPLFNTGSQSQLVVPQNVNQVPIRPVSSAVTVPSYTFSGGVLAQGYVSTQETLQTNQINPTPTMVKPKPQVIKKKSGNKKNAPILPRPDQNSPSNLPSIVPRIAQGGVPQQTLVQQPMLQNVQFTTQDVIYQTDPQNPEAKVMVKTLLAKKIREGNVIIQQPMQGMMNVDLGTTGDGQSIQYQTNFPQGGQQAAYIQYAAPGSTVSSGGQTYIQTQSSSQVQTFVVQQGDMYVQGGIPVSSLNTQLVASQQQPIMVMPQQQIIGQPQVVVSHQPMVISQQQYVTQQQFVTQQQVIQSQTIPQSQFLSQHVIIQSQPSIVQQSSQMPLQMSSSLSSSTAATVITPSSFPSLNQSSVTVNSASHLLAHSSDLQYSTHSIVSQSQNNLNKSEFSKPSCVDPDAKAESKLDISSDSVASEIESAVGSIMEESCENTDSQDEPVMIENDGNELMFEQKYPEDSDNVGEQEQYDNVNGTAEVFAADEAAMAVEQLEQMEHSGELDTSEVNGTECSEDQMDVNDSNLRIDGTEQFTEEENEENVREDFEEVNETDQSINVDGTLPNGEIYKESSVEKETDAELIARFRAETPITVPLVSENGLFEQDFEIGLAVENLLKDVEFKVSATDEDSLEGNVSVITSRQENQSSVKTEQMSGECDKLSVEENSLSISSESQSNEGEKTLVTNHVEPSSIVSKSVDKSHTLQNGLENGHSKSLLNGDLSSPECPSVPSPGLENGEPTKLVNGISEENLDNKTIDKIIKMNGVVNHKITSKLGDVKHELDINVKKEKVDVTCEQEVNSTMEDILAKSILDSNIDKVSDDSNDQTIKVESADDKDKSVNDGDILAQSILENDIQPSDCEMPDPEPTSVTAVVKQIIPNTMYGNIMTVQINNSTIPITFTTNNAIIPSKNPLTNQINVCSSRHIPTPEAARDGELSCDSTTSSINTSELSISVSDKHSIAVSLSKSSHKNSKKSLASPKASDGKKTKAKKRSRSKSGGSGSADSRPSSVTSPAPATTSMPEYMCEWTQCRQCFDNAKSVFHHVCSVHLKTEYDGLCKWEGCERLVRKRWSLFTHVQDHHCSESSLRVAAQRRMQSFQTGQKIAAPTIPAMVYPNEAANQAIKRFLPKPPYPEFMEGREGPVTKHIRLTSALILRNLAKYSAAGRSLIKKHERTISYTCMSAVESSTALAKCLHEIVQDQ